MKMRIFNELQRYVDEKVNRYDVPGHKGSKNLFSKMYKNKNILEYDINSMPRMDNLNDFSGIIKKTQQEIAGIHGAEQARILVNGTTVGIQAMILSTVLENEKILIPINAHKSVASSLILSGAFPIYFEVKYNENLGIYTVPEFEDIEKKIKANPDVKTIFLINPSYYGFSGNLGKIIKYCQKKGILIIVDEAHGGMSYFFNTNVKTATFLGADITCISYHKSLGSLTQSSLLLINNKKLINKVDRILRMLTTTSPSYFLITSVEVAVSYASELSADEKNKLVEISSILKKGINRLEYFNLVKNDDFSKVVIDCKKTPYTGQHLYNLLIENHNIQPELYENNIVLFVLGIGDDNKHAYNILSALQKIDNSLREALWTSDFKKEKSIKMYKEKRVFKYSPRYTFIAQKKMITLDRAVNKVAAKEVMVYPPGIPIIGIGEYITDKHIKYLKELLEQRIDVQGIENGELEIVDEGDL